MASTLAALRERLAAMYPAGTWSVGALADDGLVLGPDGDAFAVVYAERGRVLETLFRTPVEAEACAFYASLLAHQPMPVGFFEDVARADALCAALESCGVPLTRDHVPYGGPDDPRYRVFVRGADIEAARAGAAALVTVWPGERRPG